MLNALRDDDLSQVSGGMKNADHPPAFAANHNVLSEAQLDLVAGGMNVQINQISSSVGNAAGSGSGLLQKVMSLVAGSLKAAESVTQHGHPH